MAHYSTQEKPILNQRNLSKKLTKNFALNLLILLKRFLKNAIKILAARSINFFEALTRLEILYERLKGEFKKFNLRL